MAHERLHGKKLLAASAAGLLSLIVIVGVTLWLWGATATAPAKPHRPKPAKPKPPAVAVYQFPDGGRTLIPDYRLVALYGTPGEPVLGVLGQQPLDATLQLAKTTAAAYQPLVTEHVLPTLEIITTIASGSPTANNDYSRELPIAELQPWITAARDAGIYVVLDLQPGRAELLTQAKEYAALLKQPNVGLALDPEWQLTSTELPLQQIGTIDVSEINKVSSWLAGLTDKYHLPQKLLLLHQFRLSMITNRGGLDTAYPELAFVIQMDGQGQQSLKLNTWAAITADPPAGVYFGWKNFYQKDTPVRSPADTMQLTPEPWYVSYQ